MKIIFLSLTLLFLLASIIIPRRVDGVDEIDAREELENLKGPIGQMINVLQPEIHEKFEKAKMRDKELEKIQTKLHKLYMEITNNMEEGRREIMERPELNMKEDIDALLEALAIGHFKDEPALTFLDSSKLIVEKIFKFLYHELNFLDFMFKTSFKTFFQEFGLGKFHAMPKIRNLFGKCLKLIERGQIHIKKWNNKQEMQKSELYAKHLYLLDIVNSAIELQNELAKNSRPIIANTMAAQLGDNFIIDVQPKYLHLERNIRFLLGAFQTDAKPIDEEIAKKLTIGDQKLLDKLLNTTRDEEEKDVKIYHAQNVRAVLEEAFKNLSLNKDQSQNDDENWKQFREWGYKVLIQVGKILMAYFGEEEKYLKKKYILQPEIAQGNMVKQNMANIEVLTKLKTKTANYLKDLIDYTNDAPLLKENRGEPVIWRKGIRVKQNSKYPGEEFVDLFLQQSSDRLGLVIQAFLIMHITQIKKQFELVENKQEKTGKENLFIKKYNENRQFIDGMAKMGLIVWPAIKLHIAMQHWYLEKSPKNAENIKIFFNGLKNTLKFYGIKKDIDEHTAMRLVENETASSSTVEEIFILYEELFGVHFNLEKKEIVHEWALLASIGKLLEFFYKEKEVIEKALTLQKKGETSSSSASVNVNN